MSAIPDSVEQISPDWLLASIQSSDAAIFSNLISIRAERLGEGSGMLSDLHRLHLAYAPGVTSGPATLVAKLPSAVPEVLQIARTWGLYEREAVFYRDIASVVGLRVPRAYVTQFDPDTHHFALIMEDLAPAVDGDQITGLPLEHARLALDALADLHARWWDHPRLTALKAVIQPFGEGSWAGTGARLAEAWPIFRPFLDGRASPALIGVGERMASTIDRQMADIAKAPRTLCHGDFRADNLMFDERGGPTALATIDWQLSLQARGAVDVSQLLSISVTTDLRRAHEQTLLRGYHDRLTANGVENYGYDEFFDDYRHGLLIGFFYVIQSASANDLSHPRTVALYESAVRRLDAVVQDHDLEKLVA
jgi:hypothetical protein